MITDIIIIFVLPLYPSIDKNGYFIKLTILLLFIGWFMCFNILTEFKIADLHFYLHDDDEITDSKFINWFINAIPPYLFVYLVIQYFRKAI